MAESQKRVPAPRKRAQASVGSSPSRGGRAVASSALYTTMLLCYYAMHLAASVTAVSVDSTQLKANVKPSSAVSALIVKLAGIYQRCAERPWAWSGQLLVMDKVSATACSQHLQIARFEDLQKELLELLGGLPGCRCACISPNVFM